MAFVMFTMWYLDEFGQDRFCHIHGKHVGMSYEQAVYNADIDLLIELPPPTHEQLCERNNRGQTILMQWVQSCLDQNHDACIPGCIELAGRGWSLVDVDNEGNNLLHMVSRVPNCPPSLGKFFIRSKVNPNQCNANGERPSDVAPHMYNQKSIKNESPKQSPSASYAIATIDSKTNTATNTSGRQNLSAPAHYESDLLHRTNSTKTIPMAQASTDNYTLVRPQLYSTVVSYSPSQAILSPAPSSEPTSSANLYHFIQSYYVSPVVPPRLSRQPSKNLLYERSKMHRQVVAPQPAYRKRSASRSRSPRKRSLSRSKPTTRALQLSQATTVKLDPKILSDQGSFIVRCCTLKKQKQLHVIKYSKWNNTQLHASIEREAQMATMLVHPKIVRFVGLTDYKNGPALIYVKQQMTLEDAIRTCRKPSKEVRISMAQDILEAVAWMHALDVCHTALNLKHTFVTITYPWILRIPYVQSCLVGNVAYATKTTLDFIRQDLVNTAMLICCIMYWERINDLELEEWIHTFTSRHALATQVMRTLTDLTAYNSAVDWLRTWKLATAK